MQVTVADDTAWNCPWTQESSALGALLNNVKRIKKPILKCHRIKYINQFWRSYLCADHKTNTNKID